MPMEAEPIVGAVYEDTEGRSFEVVSFDENVGTIEVQYADDTRDEIDLDAWYEMDLKRVEEEEGDNPGDDDTDASHKQDQDDGVTPYDEDEDEDKDDE